MHTSSGKMLRLTAVFGAAAVIIGAFGAHALKNTFESLQLDVRYLIGIYEKGVQYQFYHTLALGLVSLMLYHHPASKWLPRAGWLFVAGMLLFPGSLYLLACRDLIPFPVGWAGPVTPLGGMCFIGGWIALLASSFEKK